MKIYKNVFGKIISLENLFSAWDKFSSDKKKKRDVVEFEWEFEQNIFQLHRDLKNKNYKHGTYTSFYIQDPKQRHIHKAIVRDRVLHHAVFSVLNPIFEPTFIAHSLSCRVGKGTHKGVDILDSITKAVSHNIHKPCFALKCDIKKFFGTVDHTILMTLLVKRIKDADAMLVLKEIVESLKSEYSNLFQAKGLPIGNLTSQLFANIYLNEFDQFVKHRLKIKNYVRYTDDFVIISDSKTFLENLIEPIRKFLHDRLALELHPRKVSIRKLHWGVDFLGYIVLPHHRLLRRKTKQRILRKLHKRVSEYKSGIITKRTLEQSLQSYLGVLSHANTHKFGNELKNKFWFWLSE
ncbi:MAG: group II intron reverse transcriptase domain-containing protein [Candidatus Sungiibacteriota bacterium]|uniref:Group II intron reverse transcriptase domain-containing protein n=1 Tax=Candidatus Sungiibacteriota bacterium TaxID=2750080 RepID=A0A7T5RJU3_9BACT|nr:MAG: group II intron reverse transcriptase domain-containing protein [Candidatus Sungbacteria bacterium]